MNKSERCQHGVPLNAPCHYCNGPAQPNEPVDELELDKRDIIAELTNAYYETYRYERPNDSTEQLTAFCRDIATNEVDNLIRQQQIAILREALASLQNRSLPFYTFTHMDQYGLPSGRPSSAQAVDLGTVRTTIQTLISGLEKA